MDGKALLAALDYIPRWVEHQMRLAEQPGCAGREADTAPTFPRRIAFEELHRRGGAEAA